MNWDRVLRWISGLSLAILLLVVVLIAPIDFTPLKDQPFYTRMMVDVEGFQTATYPATGEVKAGWSKFSIVPDHPVPMAGYKPRPEFESVYDTLFIRILSIDNGGIAAYFVSADLLLFPPALKNKIAQRLGPDWNGFVYYSATHTHTSVGGWDPSPLGQILMGRYDDIYLDELADQVVTHINLARESAANASIAYWEKDIVNYISNRINRLAPVDGKMRGLVIDREDGKKAIQIVLGAHPTFIAKRFTALSGDFPASLQQELSKTYAFTQYMSGMVGSQRFRGLRNTFDFELVDQAGKLLAHFVSDKDEIGQLKQSLQIETGRIPIEYGDSQLRISDSFRLRDWLFRALSRPLQGEVTYLQMGNVLYLGMPCDFSGEIYVAQEFENLAAGKGLKLIVTSFNGDYSGYFTEDAHYLTSDDEEVRILNWVGPYFGQYSTDIIRTLVKNAD